MFAVSMCAVSVQEVPSAHIAMRCLRLGVIPAEHQRSLQWAEKIASRMFCEDRMWGSIDQVEAVIHFEDDTEGLQQWDQQVSYQHISRRRAREAKWKTWRGSGE